MCGGKSAWAPTGFLRSRQNPKPSKVCPVNATAYNNRRRHGYRASRPNTRRGRAEFSTEIITSIAENFCRNESGASENFAIRLQTKLLSPSGRITYHDNAGKSIFDARLKKKILLFVTVYARTLTRSDFRDVAAYLVRFLFECVIRTAPIRIVVEFKFIRYGLGTA